MYYLVSIQLFITLHIVEMKNQSTCRILQPFVILYYEILYFSGMNLDIQGDNYQNQKPSK